MTEPAQPESQPSAEGEEARFQRLYETVWRQRLYDSLNDPSISQPQPQKLRTVLPTLALLGAGIFVFGQIARWIHAGFGLHMVLVLVAFPAIMSPFLVRGFRGMRAAFAPSAQERLRKDKRRPVLYLRSFALDETLNTRISLMSRLLGLLSSSQTLEEKVVSILSRLGPVIAIGRPGETLPTVGAARFYVGDDRWNQKVAEIASVAQLVIWASGTTDGLRWELQYLLKMLAPGRLLLWLHPNILGLHGAAREAEWRKFLEQFGDLLPAQFPAAIGETRFIYLRADGAPVAVSPDDYVVHNPDKDALRNLLSETGWLATPWWVWRTSSKTTAVALGFAAGMISWLEAGIAFFVIAILWEDPELPAGVFLERIFSKDLSWPWLLGSFACGGLWGIVVVLLQPYLAHRRIKYPLAAILFATALGWMSYAALLFESGMTLVPHSNASHATNLVNAVLWPTLWGALWGYFTVLALRLLPAAPGRPKPPIP
jgi:hypothetical protein